MMNLKFSAGLWIYGPVPDRYLPTGYQLAGETEERIEKISKTKGITGVEMPFGPVITSENAEQMGCLVKKYGLEISSLTVNVVGSRKWALGSLTNPDAAVRKDAVQMIKESMQAAKALKVETVNLWMGQEGFDYPFETDYRVLWKHMREGLKECASSCPEVKLSLEYKRMEPRARCIPNSASHSLLMVQDVGEANLGVTMDIGHALLGGENASQSALMLSEFGKLFHVHMNDNYADWDWDMAAGVNHWWQLVEFCYWLQELNFDRYLVLDVFPYRQAAEKVCETSIKAIKKAFSISAKLDRAAVKQCFESCSSMEVFNMLFD